MIVVEYIVTVCMGGHTFWKLTSQSTGHIIIIDREAREIVYLVASIRLSVCNALLLEPFDL